jgi:hypothetical protein
LSFFYRIGISLLKALHYYARYDWGASQVLYGGIELTFSDRWEEGAEDIEDEVSCCVCLILA